MKAITALLALAAFSIAAIAAPPAGHPAIESAAPPAGHPPMGAADMSHATAALTKTGKVVSVVDAKQFTYIEVKTGGKSQWVVSPAIAVKPGNTIRYADGAVMAKFHSKAANRDFSNVLFTTRVVVDK